MSVKLIDYKSKEKEIILEVFNEMPMMDNWIASVIESYIFEWMEEKDKEGNLKCRYRTKFGVKDGEYTQFYPFLKDETEQRVCVIHNYKDGLLDGESKSWFRDGKQMALLTHKEGKPNGLYRNWYPNGQIWIHTYYKDGKLHGEHVNWYLDGILSKQSNYKEGKLHGEYKSWWEHSNGQIKDFCNFKDGKLHGDSYEFYKDANKDNDNLYKYSYYEEDILYSEKVWDFKGNLISDK